ncbi:MAG TPA: caspase family protein [Abditibacterium sp.]
MRIISHRISMFAALGISFLMMSGHFSAQAQEVKPSGRPQPVLQTTPKAIYCVAWSPDGKTLATGTRFGAIRLWDARTGALLRALEKIESLSRHKTINTLAFSPDGQTIASGNDYGEVQLWNVGSGEMVRRLEQGIGSRAHRGEIFSLAWSPDGQTLATASQDKTAALWDARNGALISTLKGHKTLVGGVAFSPDGKTLASVAEKLNLWDARTGTPRSEWPLETQEQTSSSHDVAWSSDGTKLAIARFPLVVWDVATQKSQTGKIPIFPGDIWAVAFSPDGKTIATAHGPESDDRRECDVLLWDSRTLEPRQTLRGHKKAISDLCFSPDGKSLASVGLDGAVKIWPLLGNRPPVSLVPMDGNTSDWIALSEEGFYDAPDSKSMASEIKWRVGNQEWPLETFAPTFHRPDIVRRLLQSEPIAPNSPLGLLLAARSAPPSVAFLPAGEKEKVQGETAVVQVAVSDELADPRLEFRVNGRPVTVSWSVGPPQTISDSNRAQVLGGKIAPASHAVARHYNATIPLPPGETQILVRAIATDASGLESAADFTIKRELTDARGMVITSLSGAAAREATKAFQGDLHVLSIGVSQYKDAAFNLQYPVADATSFGALWPPMKDRLYQNVLLTQLADSKATVPAIQAQLSRLIKSTTNKDTVIIFLAGHGLKVNEQNFYFATHEADFENPQKTALPWTALTEVLAKVPAKRVVLFLDACHSGSALGEARASNERMAETLVRRAGVMVFASSRGDQASFESPEWKHGAFTKAVLEGIGEGKANFDSGVGQDGTITVAKLLVYLQARVPKMTQDQQHPTCPLMQDFGEPFQLAKLTK